MLDLNQYDAIVVSLSGGKDSQVTLALTAAEAERQMVKSRLMAVYADTGAEWFQTQPHCDYLCNIYGVPLKTVYPLRPLPETIERRGMWPSMKCRYCTSDAKTAPISKFIRNRFPFKHNFRLLMVSGERKRESINRSRLDEFYIHSKLSAGRREVHQWHPVLEYTKEDIWSFIRASGIEPHIAYNLGNDRLSCAMCIFANAVDLRNGAEARPDLAERFLKFERTSGHSFRHKQTLDSILNQIDVDQTVKPCENPWILEDLFDPVYSTILR